MSKRIYTSDEIKEILNPIFSSYNIKSAILFGSCVRGDQRENSDVDICVDSGLRGMSFFGLLEDITERLDKKVDLLDVSQIEKDSLVDREIHDTGVLIYDSYK